MHSPLAMLCARGLVLHVTSAPTARFAVYSGNSGLAAAADHRLAASADPVYHTGEPHSTHHCRCAAVARDDFLRSLMRKLPYPASGLGTRRE
ncbi:hypothetical protein BN77_2663 [Rhizobium mesoamericanum STM3625]|uniref:Uncharacterized protein n=1 Tax=Rhizobium mesoamericanum STM3625 TaxID=1211777 RepID=K0PNL9_9HYPH|nr:hypothetical protein BN77_2663 [Rhizobium mesoamericanum STM3625]